MQQQEVMTPGTRVRFNEKCVWPERVGCEGVVVTNRLDGSYPQPARNEVIVLLDADPYATWLAKTVLGQRATWWSCVTTIDSLDLIEQ